MLDRQEAARRCRENELAGPHTVMFGEGEVQREGGNTHRREYVMELTLYSKDSCPSCCILDARLFCKLLRVRISIRYILFCFLYIAVVNYAAEEFPLIYTRKRHLLCVAGTNILTVCTTKLKEFVTFCRVRSCS